MGVLLLVRHGQASFGGDDYDVLSGLGFEQARLLGARLARLAAPVDAVLSGRLRRQRETVQGICETLGYDASLARNVPGSPWPSLPAASSAPWPPSCSASTRGPGSS